MNTASTPTADVAPLFDLPIGHVDLRSTIRDLVRDRVAPRAADIDRDARFPEDVRRLFADQGLFGLPFAEEFGGTGTGHLMLCVAIEEIARACATSALMLAVQDLGSLPLRLGGSPELKARELPTLASGERLIAFALSEPDAGSDPAGMRTRARREADGWIIDGTKNWISQAGVADVYVVFAVTDPAAKSSRGVSAFLVPADAPGFTVGPPEHKLGIKGSPTAALAFDSVKVPADCLIGAEGRGFALAMATLDRSRLGIAAQALGIAQGALDYAADYAQERRQFGAPIFDLQAIQFKLADMSTQTSAARELLYAAAARADRNAADLGHYSAMAKLLCSDTAMAVTIEAVQILGGYGYVNDYPVERMMRDAKITQIYEGTNEIQRLVIARGLRRSI